MPKVRITKIHQKKDLAIKITRFAESIKVMSKYKEFDYIENRPFIYGKGNEIVGWNVRDINDFWIPYISRIYANAKNLEVNQSIVIYVERR